MKRTQLTSHAEVTEGEPLEHKCERMVQNKEPITDGAPEIFMERKEGVWPGYNIRTDRWEIAAEAMDKIEASHKAKRESKAKAGEEAQKPAEGGGEGITGGESTQGKTGDK